MTSPQKRKGDSAELECARIIADLTGWPARRKLGAGRQDDTGDIDGVPDTTVQVTYQTTSDRVVKIGMLAKPREVDQQAVNAGTTFAVTWVRTRGGQWRVVLTPEQWATYAREASKEASDA